jgi:hypothetical protein
VCFVATVVIASLAAPVVRAATAVGLELVLAVDVSSSVDPKEYALQRDGIATALRHPAVGAAIEALPGGVAIAVVQWSSFDRQSLAVPWTRLTIGAEATAFSHQIAAMPRQFSWGQTLIGEALSFAAGSIRSNGFTGRRRVIDLSGDGGARYGTLPRRHRDRVVAEGVTINGLAILTHDPTLADYYRANVIGGFAAFVMTAATLDDFADAMIRKLLQEIGGEPLARRAPMAVSGAG